MDVGIRKAQTIVQQLFNNTSHHLKTKVQYFSNKQFTIKTLTPLLAKFQKPKLKLHSKLFAEKAAYDSKGLLLVS